MYELPLLERVDVDTEFEDCFISMPINVPFLGAENCTFILEGYAEDECKEDFHVAIQNILNLDLSVLHAAEEYAFQYYQNIIQYLTPDDDWYVDIDSPKDVWEHVQFGCNLMVSRRERGDKGIYISLECDCDWEQEHGMQMIFKNGLFINKLGGYNGHLTNSDAFGDESLEHVVYK